MQLAELLVESCFLPNLSSSLTSVNGSIVECDEEAVSKVEECQTFKFLF